MYQRSCRATTTEPTSTTTLKERPLIYEHLVPFIEAYNVENRHDRAEGERFRRFTYEDVMARDKVSLDGRVGSAIDAAELHRGHEGPP